MATIKELQSKIATLEKGMKAKAVSPTAKAKAKLQIAKFKKEIADLKKSDTKKKSSTSKAKEIAKKYRKNYDTSRPFGGSSIEQDADRPAKRIGRRTSKDGNTYYEYRENRTDRKQPPKRYPRLEEGGKVDAKNTYLHIGKNYKGYYVMVSVFKDSNLGGQILNDGLTRDEAIDFANATSYRFNLTPNHIILMDSFEYADGGYMAKGGEISNYKITPYKTIGIENKPDLVEPYYSLSYTISGSLSEANESAQKFIRTNDEIISAVVTKIHPSGNPLKNKKVSYVTKDEISKYADGGTTMVGGTEYSSTDLSGIFAKGGDIKNQYKGRKPEDIWDSWTISQRVHFLKDHYLPNLEKSLNKREYEHAVNSISEVSLMNWDKLPSSVHMEVERHIFMGQYEHGGELHRTQEDMYARGGMTKYKYKVILEAKGEKHDVAVFTAKGDAFICINALQEKAPKDYHYKLI